MKHAIVLSLSLCSLSMACAAEPIVDPGAEDVGSAAAEERWSAVDDPGRLGPMVRVLGMLPTQGAARVTPWAGSYWPTAQDSINFRWAGAGTASPARKYAVAFGAYGVEAMVSATFGVNSQRGFIPNWFGICDGWAAASILFPEPRHAVTYNGVTFQVQDIKALLSLLYAHGSARTVALACHASAAGGTLGVDRVGRPARPECRDTNAGTFHVVVANLLGLRGQAFVEDRTFDLEVWNQPVRSYRVLSRQEISAQEANQLVGVVGGRYAFDRSASRFARVRTVLYYITESPEGVAGNLSRSINALTLSDVYDYVLELDAGGSIIGGEWIGASKTNHPDYLWIPTGPAASSVAGVSYQAVRALAAASL